MDASFMAAALATARSRMSAVPATVSGYRLFWVSDGKVGWRDLTAGGPYAILGSHERCDAVLPDPGVALRHVLATTVELSDGPALRLLDLHSDMPFCLQDGSPQRSIVGTGTVVARLGWTVFGGVPIEPGHAPEAAAPMPELVVTNAASAPRSGRPASELVEPEKPPAATPSSHPESPAASSAPEGSGSAAAPAPRRRTCVTSMPPSKLVANLPPRPPSPPEVARSSIRELAPPGAPSAGGAWTVTLEREGRAASVTLTDDELSLGVVIGRAVNCHDRGLRAVLETSISRGHLLLLHHHDTYEAYDLCSLNGTWESGKSVKRRRLGSDKVVLSLSNHQPVVLHWHGRG
jgi:hypothetical protein